MKAKFYVNFVMVGSYTKAKEESIDDFLDEVESARAFIIREEKQEPQMIITGKKNNVQYMAGTVYDLMKQKVFIYCDTDNVKQWAIILPDASAYFGDSFESLYREILN